MCVNRSGYYKWLKRGPNQYELDRTDLTVFIKETHEDYPSYGYHSIAKEVRKKTGLVFSDNLIHKICKYEHIWSKAKHYKVKKTSGEEHIIYSNKIRGDWTTTAPLQKVVSDMTVVPFDNKLYEWTYFLDVYNDSIIASYVSGKRGDPRPYFKCRDDLIKLIKKEELPEPIIFHTDQGAVYFSISFNQALLNNNIIRSMSRAGTPTDNPVIESMNGWIKAQIKCDYNMKDYDSIEEFISKYVHYYNYERPMYKLKYKSPAEYTLEQGFKLSF